MSEHLIPDEMAQRTGRLINEAENVRAQAVDDLKTIYADLREELKSLGWRGAEVSEQVAAFKAAISEMRLDDEKKAKREAKGDLVSEYINVLTVSRARARARAKESAEALDAQTSAPAGAASDKAPATHSPDPHSFMGEDGRPLTRIPAVGAKNGGSNAPAGQVAANGEASSDQGIQQSSSAPQAGNEAGSESGLSVTFINPKCLKPKTCPNAHSKTACFDCVMEYGKRPPEEQKRLWAEATGVAA